MNLDDLIIDKLKKLRQLHYDARRTYRDAIDVLPGEKEKLHRTLEQFAETHGAFLEELKKEMIDRYIAPERISNFFNDSLNSMSMRLITILSTDDRRVVLKKCEQVEIAMLDDYKAVLEIEELPEKTRSMLKAQHRTVQEILSALEEEVEDREKA